MVTDLGNTTITQLWRYVLRVKHKTICEDHCSFYFALLIIYIQDKYIGSTWYIHDPYGKAISCLIAMDIEHVSGKWSNLSPNCHCAGQAPGLCPCWPISKRACELIIQICNIHFVEGHMKNNRNNLVRARTVLSSVLTCIYSQHHSNQRCT